MLYRIVHNRYLATAWTGYGAETYGGRWNHKGHAAIYLASSVSLAMLETLVHVEDSATLNDFNLFQITIPDNAIMVLQQQDWPRGWRDDPPPWLPWTSAPNGLVQHHLSVCWYHPR